MNKKVFIISALVFGLASTASADRRYYLCDVLKSKFCGGLRASFDLDENSNIARTSEMGGATFNEPNGADVGRSAGLLGANGLTAYGMNHTAAANNYLTMQNGGGLIGSGTIALWIKVSAYPSVNSTLSRLLWTSNPNTSSATYPMLYLTKNGSGTQQVCYDMKEALTDTIKSVCTATSGETAQWHLVTFGVYALPNIYTANKPLSHVMWIQWDAGTRATTTTDYGPQATPGDLMLGESVNSGSFVYGAYVIDQLNVWDWTFSTTDVTNFYNSRAGRAYPFTYFGY